MKPPSFAVRMKPVAFNIKPKVGVVSTSTKQPTKDAVTDQAALPSEATVKQENQQPSSAVTSLGLAYGSKVTTRNCDASRPATPIMRRKWDTACSQFQHKFSKVTNGS
jgi:hypothetical protein